MAEKSRPDDFLPSVDVAGGGDRQAWAGQRMVGRFDSTPTRARHLPIGSINQLRTHVTAIAPDHTITLGNCLPGPALARKDEVNRAGASNISPRWFPARAVRDIASSPRCRRRTARATHPPGVGRLSDKCNDVGSFHRHGWLHIVLQPGRRRSRLYADAGDSPPNGRCGSQSRICGRRNGGPLVDYNRRSLSAWVTRTEAGQRRLVWR